MPKYSVNLEDGRIAQIETETPVESNEQMQQIIAQQMGQSQEQPSNDVATPEQYLGMGERFFTGFELDPNAAVEQKVAERGLEPGTALEPTPFNSSLLENIKDFPADIADMVGPAFPMLGSFFGFLGGSALGSASTVATVGAAAPTIPAQAYIGSVAGAAGGELVRQEIGRQLGFDPGTIGEKAKRIGTEAAFAGIGEGVAFGLGKAINATKTGIIKAGNKILEKKGIDGFTKIAGKVFRNMDAGKIDVATQMLRKGDTTILKKELSNTKFAENFFRKLFLGEEVSSGGKVLVKRDLAKQIRKIGRGKAGRDNIRQLFERELGLSGESFDVALKKGSQLAKYNTEKGVMNLGKRISTQMDDLFTKVGNDLGDARNALVKSGGAVPVGEELTAANMKLANGLADVDLLLKEGNGMFSFNPKFNITSTGSTQSKNFAQIVNKFFDVVDSKTGNVLINAGDQNSKLLAQAGGWESFLKNVSNRKGRQLLSPSRTMKYKEFAGILKSFDIQISGNEFKAAGKLSPQLTEYLQGIRGITEKVAKAAGDDTVVGLNAAYKELAEVASPLRIGKKFKSGEALEKTMMKLSNPKGSSSTQEAGEALNSYLKKNLDINFIDEARAFKASKEIGLIEKGFGATDQEKIFVGKMKDALDGNQPNSTVRAYQELVDPYLPNELKPGLNSIRHTISESLEKDSTSILKARFISGGLGLGGFLAGGPAVGAAGLVTGFAAQNPKLLKSLIKFSAKHGGKRLAQPAVTQVPRQGIVSGSQLLGQLINNNSPK